jgi:hypothetical protein
MRRPKVNAMFSRTSFGTSRRSFSFAFGRISLAQPGAVGGEHLLLHAADLEHLAAQRHLAGHREVAAHRAAREHARDRERDRDAGRRARPWGSRRGEVDVESRLLEILLVEAELARARAHERVRASTLSRITSPSWPVTVRRPLPGMRSASITIRSPPVDVHARPGPRRPPAPSPPPRRVARRAEHLLDDRESSTLAPLLAVALRRARLRMSVARLRPKLRSPASRE